MADEFSFDIVSEVDLQQMDDAINVTVKEINNRFDLKTLNTKIDFNRGDKTITFNAPSEFVIKQLKDILLSKMVKRNISPKVLSVKKSEQAAGNTTREVDNIIAGIEKELAKSIVKDIKGLNLKVQASINDDIIRVTGKVKDDLQAVMHMVKEKDYPAALQFKNYR